MGDNLPLSRVTIRDMQKGEEAQVCKLVLDVFNETTAKCYSQNGVDEFRSLMTVEKQIQRVENGSRVLVATVNDKIAGVVEIRKNSHISRLFVDVALQKQGIARQLFRKSVEFCLSADAGLSAITVNSSPNAVEAYQALGFISKGPEETAPNGIRFTPMMYPIKAM